MALPSLTLRNTKGSALTFTEMDTNLTNLQAANIVVAVTGSSSTTLSLNDTIRLSPGTGISLTNSSGNITITNSYGNTQVQQYLTAQNISGYGDANVAAYTGNIQSKVSGYTIGYLNMPQVAAGNVTLALTDSGKHYYSTATAPTTITVPNAANVAFDTGSVITIVNKGTGNISLAKQDAISLYLVGNATSATRTITSYGVATLIKVDTNIWFVNGNGVV